MLRMGDSATVLLDVRLSEDVKGVEIGFTLKNNLSQKVASFIGEWEGLPTDLPKGDHRIRCRIPSVSLLPGDYALTAWIKRSDQATDEQIPDALPLTVLSGDAPAGHASFGKYPDMGAYLKSDWSILSSDEAE